MSGKILRFIFIFSGLFALRCGATVYQSNGSASNVQALHNSAQDGDTITLPAGTFFWATTVTITKGITVIGETTTDPVHKTANDQTIVLANTGTNGNQPLLNLATAYGKSYRLSGITFRTGQTQIVNSNGMVQLQGGSHAVRVDHCHFDDLPYENNYVAVWRALYGVIDHNVFDFRSPNNHAQSLYINMSDWGGRSYGDGSWAEPPYYGSEKFVFIEDNCFNNTTSNEFAGVIDGWRGGRYVFRHNHAYNATPTNHGTEIGRERGFRCAEIYNNDFHFTDARGSLGGTRSGGWISHDNTVDGQQLARGATLGTYRVFFAFIGAPFTGASGDNPWDYNVTEWDGRHIDGHPPYLFESGSASSGSDGTHIVDLTKNWRANQWIGYAAKRLSDGKIALVFSNTTNTLNVYYHDGYGGGPIWQAGDQYQIHKVLVALDQPGRGASDLIAFNDDSGSGGIRCPPTRPRLLQHGNARIRALYLPAPADRGCGYASAPAEHLRPATATLRPTPTPPATVTATPSLKPEAKPTHTSTTTTTPELSLTATPTPSNSGFSISLTRLIPVLQSAQLFHLPGASPCRK